MLFMQKLCMITTEHKKNRCKNYAISEIGLMKILVTCTDKGNRPTVYHATTVHQKPEHANSLA